MVVFDRLWSGRAVTEHKYVFLVFCALVCLHVSLYVSNHINHCIKLFAPCGTLIGNKNILILIVTEGGGQGRFSFLRDTHVSTYFAKRIDTGGNKHKSYIVVADP